MVLADIAPFAGLAGAQIAAMAAIYAVSFFVKGMFGYGAVPLLIVAGSFVVEPHHAVLLAALTNLMTHAQYLPEGFRHGHRRQVAWLALFLMPSIVAGVWVFARLDGSNLNLLAGLVILVSVLVDWFRLLDPLAPYVRANVRLVGPVVGTVSGVISGVIGAGAVSVLSLYVRMIAPGRHEFRSTIVLISGVILLWRIFVLTLAGFVDLTLAAEALLLLPVAVAGGFAGQRVFGLMNDGVFFNGYRLVLVLGSALMVVRGLMGSL